MLGVLGGMGPAAGAYFALRLALLTDADKDQEHLPLLLVNDPRIPDRSQALVGRGADPLPAMRGNLRMLEVNGCSCAVIPCNTAHHWFDELQASVEMPILHIVSCVVERLRATGLAGGRIAVLGTPATVGSELYRVPLERAGYEVLTLSPDEVQLHCVIPIQAVKSNRIAQAAPALARSIRAMHARGAAAVILGCTELPVALAALHASELSLPVVDSIDALAAGALAHFGFQPPRGEP